MISNDKAIDNGMPSKATKGAGKNIMKPIMQTHIKVFSGRCVSLTSKIKINTPGNENKRVLLITFHTVSLFPFDCMEKSGLIKFNAVAK